MLGLYGDKLVEWRQMRRLVGRHWWTGVQDKMLTGDQWWKCLIGHRQMLHGAGLNERACWELLSIAGWDRLPGVDGETMGRHRGNCVRYRNGSLMHLFVKIHHDGALLGGLCGSMQHAWRCTGVAILPGLI